MGLNSSGSSTLPQRPKFSWDMKAVPWTDGRGDQDGYARAVSLWKKFHDTLPVSNSNKIPVNLQGIMLQSNLYGRAQDLVKGITDDVICGADGATAIVKAIHSRDPLAVVSEVFKDFNELLAVIRGENETFKDYEGRFAAKAAKFNAHSTASELPEALVAFLLLANSKIDSGQRISVLASAAPAEGTNDATTTTDAYLKAIKYSSVASVIRQCEVPKEPLSIYAINAMERSQRLKEMKQRSQCRKCKKWGHWASDHTKDGELKHGVKSYEKPGDAGEEKGGGGGAVTFNMVNCQALPFGNGIGPLLDDGAPYSGMGIQEFKMIQPMILPEWNGKFDALPDSIKERPFWQYGSGSHSSPFRKIIGSILIPGKSNEGADIYVRHLVIEGSTQWLIGRNLTNCCDIIRIGKNELVLPHGCGTITLKDHDLHCFVPFEYFCQNKVSNFHAVLFCATATIAAKETRPWKELKAIVDKVHRHVCGHSNYSDIKVLLERNGIWDDAVMKYLSQILEKCESCSTTALPKKSPKVSLSSMTRGFNEVVCVDHMYLEDHCVFHMMDSVTRYSSGSVVESTGMMDSIEAFESTWLNEFWMPKALTFDPAFKNKMFEKFAEKYGIALRPLPPRRHSKNVIESKHRIIRDVYLRLKSAFKDDPTVNGKILVNQSLRISNDLYGNDVMSAHELAKGYTRPIENGNVPRCVPKEVVQAQEDLKAKRKLTLILRSKTSRDDKVKPGTLVQVYIKTDKQKRGTWSGVKPVLSFDAESRSVTVPGSSGRTICAAMEDVRLALETDGFANAVRDACDTMDIVLEDALKITTEGCDSSADQADEEDALPNADQTFYDGDDDIESLFGNGVPCVGDRIQVYWPEEQTFFPGKVAELNEENGKHHIIYDDGDVEDIFLKDEVWKLADSTAIVNANKVDLLPGTELSSIEKSVVDQYWNLFRSKEFLIWDAQGLPRFITHNAYRKEEDSFVETVKKVHVSDIPEGANIITSHVLYKVKLRDDGTKMIKARIAPHGNKDDMKDDLKTDSATCSPVGVRVLKSICVTMGWRVAKIDFKSAFLQSGAVERDVYVVPPRESKDRFHYWLLLTAAYGLVNASAKWQAKIDGSFLEMGFKQLVYIPQLFYKKENSILKALAVKIVDDVLIASTEAHLTVVVKQICSKYNVGTIVYGPGSFLFNGLNVTQDEDLSITVDADQKLQAIEPYPISRYRRKEIDKKANSIEIGSFRSVNGQLGWIGTAASPLCAHSSSSLQQMVPQMKVKAIVDQINYVRFLKKLGTVIRFRRPKEKGTYKLTIVVFSDASRNNANGQIGYVSGLLFGEFEKGSTFHTLSWMSKKSPRPVRSIGSAETIAAGFAIDEGKMLAKAYNHLLNIEVEVGIAVDSMDLWNTLTTCHEPNDKSVCADVKVIRYEFETKNISWMRWIPGKINLSDPTTKKDSPMVQALQLMMYDGEIPIDLTDAKMRHSSQSIG